MLLKEGANIIKWKAKALTLFTSDLMGFSTGHYDADDKSAAPTPLPSKPVSKYPV